jgi:hypothetical protein
MDRSEEENISLMLNYCVYIKAYFKVGGIMILLQILVAVITGIILFGCSLPHTQLYTVMEDRKYRSKLRTDFVKNCSCSANESDLRIEQCASKLMNDKDCSPDEKKLLNNTKECLSVKEKIAENKILRHRTDILPASLSDKYDYRERDFIEKGDMIHIIVEKVHIGSNSEFMFNAEVAVIVSVIDGKEITDKEVKENNKQNSKDVIVYFGKDVPKGFDLPFSSMLAYSGEYENQPIIVKISVLEIDEYIFDRYNKILEMAAKMGNNLSPALSATTSLAAEIGKMVLETASENDIIAEFQFPLYPASAKDSTEKEYFNKSPGITIASIGRYIILSANKEQHKTTNTVSYKGGASYQDLNHEDIYRQEAYYLDSNSNLYLIQHDTLKTIFKDPFDLSKDDDKAMYISQKENEIQKYRIREGMSYAMLTIDKRNMEKAREVITYMSRVNKKLKELKLTSKDTLLGKSFLAEIGNRINHVMLIEDYESDYSNKEKFIALMKEHDKLSPEEKTYLLQYIHKKIDFSHIQFKDSTDIKSIIEYFEGNRGIFFNEEKKKYDLRKK